MQECLIFKSTYLDYVETLLMFISKCVNYKKKNMFERIEGKINKAAWSKIFKFELTCLSFWERFWRAIYNVYNYGFFK